MKDPLVCLIDDDDVIVKILERRLIKYGCLVKTFSTAESFLAQLSKLKPDLVLIDLNLGNGLSGFEAISRIRTKFKSNVPIIILSGEKNQKMIAHGIEIGANDYIVKPPTPIEFEEIIGHYITAKQLNTPTHGSFRKVIQSKQRCHLTFQVQIEEIHPYGFTLLSDHLIKKGVPFYLQSKALKDTFPKHNRFFVSVIDSRVRTIGEQRKYELHVELDASQEDLLSDIQFFLKSNFTKTQSFE